MTAHSDVQPPDNWAFELDPSDQTRLGISFSGGGIRSATFSLGVYQRLAEKRIFQRARFLSAVSGGGYLASALAISHALSDARSSSGHPAPWWRGSAEEAQLRQNLSYLAPAGSGRLWFGANLLYGLILNLTPLILAAYLLGHIEGFVLQKLYPGLGTERVSDARIPIVAGAFAAAIVVAILAVGWRRFHDRTLATLRPRRRLSSEQIVSGALMLAGAIVLLAGAMPILVHYLARWTAGDALGDVGLAELPRRVQRVSLGLAGVGAALMLGVIALLLHRYRVFRRFRGILAAIAGFSVLFVPFVLSTETGAVLPWEFEREGVMTIVAIVIIVAFGVLAHNRRYSMHLFYRERLQEAFALKRTNDESGRLKVEPIPYDEPIFLSKVVEANERHAIEDHEPFPELVMCAAVAARGSEVPNKAHAASFTFEGKRSGNTRLGIEAATTDLESDDWFGAGGLTLPSMMAISGAALSPMMGRFTLPAFRFLMAVMNVRLGVWLQNPAFGFDRELPAWSRPFSRAWQYVRRGWREPGAWYVVKEGLGLASARGKFFYVSDGGHWENLGLTELLRRRCTNIVAIDASGSVTLADIGRAVAVARAELGVEFRFDPRITAPGADGFAESPVAVGTFQYPDGRLGDVLFARCVLWKDAPADLQMFATENRVFPNHPTANQFLTGEVFDAYRALGYAVGDVIAERVGLPPTDFDEDRAGRRFTRGQEAAKR